MERHGPLAPYFIAMLPAAIFEIIFGMNIGDTLFGPFSMRFVCSETIVSNPPMPEPK